MTTTTHTDTFPPHLTTLLKSAKFKGIDRVWIRERYITCDGVKWRTHVTLLYEGAMEPDEVRLHTGYFGRRLANVYKVKRIGWIDRIAALLGL